MITLYSAKDFVEVVFDDGATYSVEYTGLDGKWVASAAEMNASSGAVTKLIKSGTKVIVTITDEEVTMAVGDAEAEKLEAEQEITISGAETITFAQYVAP